MKFPRHNKALEYERSIVLFVDILGFKDLVDKSTPENIYYTLTKLFKPLLTPVVNEVFKYSYRQEKFKNPFVNGGIFENAQNHAGEIKSAIENGIIDIDSSIQENISYFSDSVVMSFPVTEEHIENEVKLESLIEKIENLYDRFENKFNNSIQPRGAIVIGDIYHSDNICFGPALVEAYRMESRKALVPRVLICSELQKLVWAKKVFEKSRLTQKINGQLSISKLKIDKKSIKSSFKHHGIGLILFTEEISKDTPYLFFKLHKLKERIEKSIKRSTFYTEEYLIQKEYKKIRIMTYEYYRNLFEVIYISEEKLPALIDKFKRNLKIESEKYIDHALDRAGQMILIEDEVKVYKEGDSGRYYHANCCSGRVTKVISESSIEIIINGHVSIGEKRLCSHESGSSYIFSCKRVEKSRNQGF